jgi:hypothetical protein
VVTALHRTISVYYERYEAIEDFDEVENLGQGF